jgi:transcription elongation factor Elf1
MHCPRCNQERFTTLTFDLDGGDTIDFYSCRNCEEKWWERDGNVIVLDEIFTLPEAVQAKRAGLGPSPS